MLDQTNLTLALKAGQAQADCCHPRFCNVGARVNEQTYICHHNGLGSGDSAADTIHATAVLGYDKDKLAEHLGKWLAALHKRQKLDLNLVR